MSLKDPLSGLIRFTKDLQKPFAGFRLILPGARGKVVGQLGTLEATLENYKETASSLEKVAQVAGVLVKNVHATNRIMAGVEQSTEQHRTELRGLDEGIQARIREVQTLQEEGLRLEDREKRVTEREIQTEALFTDLNRKLADVGALEHAVKDKLDDTITLAEQVQTVENKVTMQQSAVAAKEAELQDRKEKMDQFKIYLQSREEAVTKSINQISDLAQQKKAAQEELASVKAECQDEMDRSDELLRQREIAVAEREEEAASMGMMLVERERALHERQQGVEKREAEIEAESLSLKKVREDYSARERQLAELRATIETLKAQRDELNRSIASLSARL